MAGCSLTSTTHRCRGNLPRRFAEQHHRLAKMLTWKRRALCALVSGRRGVSNVSALDFSDHVRAFQQKTNWEIVRGLLVLYACSNERFAANSLQIFRASQRIFGQRIADALVRPIFYKHFVAGDTAETIQQTIDNLRKAGIAPLLAVPVEEVASDADYDINYQAMLKCLDLAAKLDKITPMMQLKMTALIPKPVLMSLNTAYWSAAQEQCIDEIANILHTGRVADNGNWILKLIPSQSHDRVLKSLRNLADIGRAACENGARILVDAEYTHINGGLSMLTQAAMLNYNREKPLIWNTYQCYLKNAKENVQRECTWAERKGICFGAKIVRGAYLNYEIEHARSQSTSIPVHDALENTHACYDDVVSYMLSTAARLDKRCNLIVASHNEQSILKAVQRMAQLQIKPTSRNIFFGQLMGMCDHVSYTLGQAGYPVYKSLPFGPVAATIPYLSRRAQENTSVIQGARREKQLLTQEIKHRLTK